MIDATYLIGFALFSISMIYTPGPNNALAMAVGLRYGFRPVLPHCCGAAIGGVGSLGLLFLGLNEVFTRFPVVYEVLRVGGAVYMLWLAWKISGLDFRGIFRRGGMNSTQASAEPIESVEPGEPVEPGAAPAETQEAQAANPADKGESERGLHPLSFRQSLLFQLLNVKAWLTNIVVLSNYVGVGEAAMVKFAFVMTSFSLMIFSSVCLWALGGVFMGRFLTSDGMRRANVLFALFLVLSMILLFLDR